MLYLLNPVSIFNCTSFKLANLFVFLAILCFEKYNNYAINAVIIGLNLAVNPSLAIMIFFYFLFLLKNTNNTFKSKHFLVILLSFAFVNLLSWYFRNDSFSHVYNYFTQNDTHPSLSLFWGLYSEVIYLNHPFPDIFKIPKLHCNKPATVSNCFKLLHNRVIQRTYI